MSGGKLDVFAASLGVDQSDIRRFSSQQLAFIVAHILIMQLELRESQLNQTLDSIEKEFGPFETDEVIDCESGKSVTVIDTPNGLVEVPTETNPKGLI